MPQTTAVAPSFSSLAAPPVSGAKIRWDAVLTLARFSELAYQDGDEAISAAKAIGAVDVIPIQSGTHEGLVAADDHAVVIGFRGTVLTNRNHIISDILGFARREHGGNVHAGFSIAVGSLYDMATAEARRLGARKKTLWITGHSLGGAIAAGFTLKAAREQGLAVNGIVTFGQPLVMDNALCEFMLAEFKDRYLRIVNGSDIVARLVDSYRHSGARARLTGDGEYEWRPPMVAPTAAAPDSRRNRRRQERQQEQMLIVDEPDPDLQLISEAEALDLERQLQAEQNAPMGAPGAVGWSPFSSLTDHMMAGYVQRITEIAKQRQAVGQTC